MPLYNNSAPDLCSFALMPYYTTFSKGVVNLLNSKIKNLDPGLTKCELSDEPSWPQSDLLKLGRYKNWRLVTHWLSPRCLWRSRRAPEAREAHGRKVSKLLWWHECPPTRCRPNSASPLRGRIENGEKFRQTGSQEGNKRQDNMKKTHRELEFKDKKVELQSQHHLERNINREA